MAAMSGDDHEPPLAKRLRELAENGAHERATELYARAGDVREARYNNTLSSATKLAMIERAKRLLWDIAKEDAEE